MKKLLLPICIGLFATVVACNKTTQQSSSPASSQATAHHSAARGSGFTKKAVMDDKGNCDCTKPGTSCKTSTKLTDEQAAEITTLTGIISSNGNGNAYFNTQNWSALFDEVNDIPGLLASIQSNQVFLYQIPSAQGSGTTFGYSYVLSTATSVATISNNNTQWTWQY